MIYNSFEMILKAALPADCRIFQANMPLQLMDTLTRESAKLCTYLIFQDRQRMNSSGITPVHDVQIEVSLYGTLAETDSMARSLNEALIGHEITSQGWRFCLYPLAQTGRRDVWDPRVQVKREWLQFRGLVIEPTEEEHDSN